MEKVDITDYSEFMENLTQMNMHDLKTKFHSIFEGDFPKDINELEDYLITFVAKCLMDDKLFKKWKGHCAVSYCGVKRTTFAVVAFLVDGKIIQSSGISIKRSGDKNNKFVGMMIALMEIVNSNQ